MIEASPLPPSAPRHQGAAGREIFHQVMNEFLPSSAI
jgi:hypothetical protein